MAAVLVVEDDLDTRDNLLEILAAEGYEAAAVATAEQGLAWMKAHEPPCLILLDLRLPGASGIEFLRWLRCEEQLRTTPVLILSAWPNAAREVAPFEEQVVGVVQKPFDVQKALANVAEFCDPDRRQDEGAGPLKGLVDKLIDYLRGTRFTYYEWLPRGCISE
jgi:CheY-like chemotaxis protein